MAWWAACLSCMWGQLGQLKGWGGGRWSWNHLKACLLTCLAFEDGCWRDLSWGCWPQYLCVPCPCGCLASSQNGGWGPRASIPNGQRVEAACLFRSGSGTYTASPDSRGGDTEPIPWWEEHHRILKLFKKFATNNVSFWILVKTCLWLCLGLIVSCGKFNHRFNFFVLGPTGFPISEAILLSYIFLGIMSF